VSDVVIEPMTEDFLLWRCLHGGPVSPANIDDWPSDTKMPWERYQRRNTALLARLTRTYGACAFVARHGQEVVGQLRFYPKALYRMKGAGMMCLQQDHPAGPVDDFAEHELPPPAELSDRALEVHCLMTGSPQQKDNPYQRKGIGTRMAEALIRWAGDNGWEAVSAISYEDLPFIYEVTGDAGHTFWEKLGFRLAERYPDPEVRKHPEFAAILEQQALLLGIDPERAKDRLVMRLDLKQIGSSPRQSPRHCDPPLRKPPPAGALRPTRALP